MKRMYKLAAATAMAGGLLFSAASAGATPGPPAGYGNDGKADIIVGGGSDTTYRAMVGLTDLYNGAPGCTVNTTRGPDLNNCVYSTNSADPQDLASLGNYDHDTIAQANPTGSGAGVGSMNNFCSSCTVTYNGTNGNADFARSSGGPKTTGGAISGGNELAGDTFWGFSQDGVEVMAFENRGAQIQAAGGSAVTPAELYHIYNCDYTKWSDVPSLGIGVGSATDGPIVPWGMNSSSGTYSTFNSYLIAAGGAPTGFLANQHSCVRFRGGYFGSASETTAPLENDIKNIFNAVPAANLAPTDYASKENPNNWIWWGSYGELSAFSYKSNYQYPVSTGNTWNALDVPINGVRPSTAKILANTYPIGRTLYHVTKNTDADCPGAGTPNAGPVNPGDACAFTGGNVGPTLPSGTGNDLNVIGATGGKGGAVREFTRWLCRSGSAAQAIDPYTGKNYAGEIATAINNAGFTVVPAALRTSGSSCQVKS